MANSGGQSHIKCQLCVTEKTIKWKCIECTLLLCDTCKNYHHKIKTAKDHQIIDIKDVGSHVRSLDFTNITCKKHPDNSCCLFCESCDTVVCAVCVANAHNKHKLIEIKVAYEEKKETLLSVSEKLEIETTQVDENEKSLLEFKKSEISRLDHVEKEVKNHGEDLKRKVDLGIEKLTQEVAQAKSTVSSTVDKEIGLIVEYKAQTALKRKQIQDLVQSFDTTEFFTELSSVKILQGLHASEASHISIGDFSPEDLSSIGTLSRIEKKLPLAPHRTAELSLTIDGAYTTDFSLLSFILVDQHNRDCLWISSDIDESVYFIHLKGDKGIDIIAKYNLAVTSMAMLNERNILSSSSKSKLDVLDTSTGNISQSAFDVGPLRSSSIHVTKSGKVIVGAVSKNYPAPGKRCVIVFNENGIKERIFEKDNENRPIFSYPRRITSTLEGYIHVADFDYKNESCGVVIVLDTSGLIINKYTGNSSVNISENFAPDALVTLNTNCVLVSDMASNAIHVLNSGGKFLRFVSTENMGIVRPYSLAFDENDGWIYIGCNSYWKEEHQTKDAKFYKTRLQ